MPLLIRDLIHSLRLAIRKPVFTVTVVVVLGLCIAANTIVFSVVNAVLLRTLPYQNQSQLVRVWATDLGHGYPKSRMSHLDLEDLKSQSRTLSELAAFFSRTVTVIAGGEPLQVRLEAVSANFFSVLGVNPGLGRFFLSAEEGQGKNNVVVLSHGFWQRRFGSDPKAIGQSVIIDGAPHTVIGVLPSQFRSIIPGLEGEPDLWRPLALVIGPRSRAAHLLMVIGRLKAGVKIEQAQTEVAAIGRRLEEEYPASNTGFGIAVEPLQQAVVGDTRTPLFILVGAVAMILLIGCGNVANLQIIRAIARQKEFAIRAALGATRGRLIRQFLTESTVLAILGGGLGLLLSIWGMRTIVSLSPSGIPRIDETNIDWRVLVFTLGLSFLTSILFGLAPALKMSRTELNDTLREGGRDSAAVSQRSRYLSNSLIVFQVGLTLVLLISAGLLLKSFFRLLQVPPGFSVENTVTAQISLPMTVYSKPEQVVGFYQSLLERIKPLPGLEAVGAVDAVPLSLPPNCNSFTIDGQSVRPGHEPCAEVRIVTPDYFKALSIPLLKGRELNERDNDKSPQVTLINDAMLRQFWPDGNPLGRRLSLGNTSLEIVGVVGSVKALGLETESAPALYLPFRQNPLNQMSLVVRAADGKGIIDVIRLEAQKLDRGIPIYNVRLMGEYLSNSLSSRRFTMLLLSIFAGLALILSMVGVYGLISYAVSQRTHEIGLRMALGAAHFEILKLIVGQGMKLAGLGVMIGLASALALTTIMESMLFQVGVRDLTIFAGASLLLISIALLASLAPALRALKVDPVLALRQE